MPCDNKYLKVELMGVDKDKIQKLLNHLNQNNFNFSVNNSNSQEKVPKRVVVPKYQVVNPEVESVAPQLPVWTMAQLEAVGNQLLSSNLTSTIPVSPNLNTHSGMFGTPEVQTGAALKIKMEEPNSENGPPSAPFSLELSGSSPGIRKQSDQQALDNFICKNTSLAQTFNGLQDKTEIGVKPVLNLREGHSGIVKPTPLLPNEYCFNLQSMNSTSVSGIPLFQIRNTNSHGSQGTTDRSSTNPATIPTMANVKQIKLEVADESYQFGKPLSSQEYNALLFRNFPFNCPQNGKSGVSQHSCSKFETAKHGGYVEPHFARFGGQQLQFSHMKLCPAQADSAPVTTTALRKRHSWRKAEKEELNEVYRKTRYPSDEKITELATKFAVDDFRVRSFFQRKRDSKVQ